MAVVQHDAESAADAAGQFYRQVAETIPHMVWAARPDGSLDFFNRRVYEYTGLGFDGLEGWSWKDVVHPDDWPNCLAIWTRALQTGERYQIEYRLKRADGAYRWHHGAAMPMRDDAGRLLRWIGTCTDIEDQIRSARILEALVRESERRFQAFMENAPLLAWAKDSARRYVYVNPAYRSFYRMAAGDVLGKTDAEFTDPETTARRKADEDHVLRLGQPVQWVRKLPGQSGSDAERHWLIVKFPLVDPGGGTGIGGIAIDISERVHAEGLAHRYAVEIRSLMNRLVATREMERRRLADELHDLIGQNLTALGIELAALDAGLSEASRARIAPRLDDMRGLLDETVGAIRGVMTSLRPPALEEYGLLAAMRSYALEYGERTGMKVMVSGGSPDLRLPKDTELVLFRIYQEAVTNATKHSGGTRVEASIEESGAAVRLVVADDGRGFIDPLGARREHRGGWGLRAMRERAEAHGGALRIEFPGRGTRLVVEIPSHAD